MECINRVNTKCFWTKPTMLVLSDKVASQNNDELQATQKITRLFYSKREGRKVKKIIILISILFIMHFLFANIINIPADQPTIQQGIDVSVDGDVVLVQPGTYLENIDFDGKNITVASLFHTTQDTSFISQTIIDGNQDGWVVTFENEEMATAVLKGLTITNGTIGIRCYASGPSLLYLKITNNSGRGLWCWKGSTPRLRNTLVTTNSGGGIECSTGSNLILENVTITNNTASDKGGGIYCSESNLNFDSENRCNIYQNNVLNSRGCGVDIYSSYCDIINVIVDTFTVLTPTDYYASPINNFTFDILNSVQDDLINSDLYVSVDGDDSNSGTTADEPLQTIRCALSKIYADSLNQNTIYLAPGIYSTETTGEIFPIEWSNYVSLDGNIENETILDANNETGIMRFRYVATASIENITIRNGNDSDCSGIYFVRSSPSLENVTITDNSTSRYGGGIYCISSSPCLENVTISDNYSVYSGGGICCKFNSNPNLTNVTLINNTTSNYGGGIYCYSNSNPILENVTITGNSASLNGGGIYCTNSSPSLENVTISNNTASSKGGGIFCTGSELNFNVENRCSIYQNSALNNRGYGLDIFAEGCETIDVFLDTFTVLVPNDYYATPIAYLNFDVLNGIQDILINSDLYVSVDGDDSNSGTTSDEPLKTIKCALSKIYADSLNQNTIFLSPGIYSTETTGEIFPIEWSNYVSLDGISEEQTILDANDEDRVMEFYYVSAASIENITVRNGHCSYGGGIHCYNSSPSFVSITAIDNTNFGIFCTNNSDPNLENIMVTGNFGGGIYCEYNSNPILENVTVTGNSGKGIYCRENSNPNMKNVTVIGNIGIGIYCRSSSNPSMENVTIVGNNGGGIYCNNSDPIFTNVIIAGNSASDFGGGVFCINNSNPVFVNVTITGNSAGNNGGGIFCWNNSYSSLSNCIMWNNSPQEIYFYQSEAPNEITISFSDIQGGLDGIETNGNGSVNWFESINIDPLFADSLFHLDPLSPCIDRGNPQYVYYDPEDPHNPGFALYPAMGTIRNDMGVYGGPNASGWIPPISVEDEIVIEPVLGYLYQNYPNPFYSSTIISFFTAENGENTEILIYNLKGQKVKTLECINSFDTKATESLYHITWNGKDENNKQVASGIYFYKLKTGKYSQTKKMILMR